MAPTIFGDHNVSDDNNNPSKSFIDRFLDKQIKTRIDGYINRYAKKEDGSVDETLANRIRWEVGRRGETGKQLDIYEPLRWTGIRAVLGVIGAATAKMITDKTTGKTKNLAWGVELGIIVSTVINSVIDLTRLFPRWLAGLEGGKNTALKLHRENMMPPNMEQSIKQENQAEEEIERCTAIEQAQTATKKALIKPIALKERASRDDGSSLPSL